MNTWKIITQDINVLINVMVEKMAIDFKWIDSCFFEHFWSFNWQVLEQGVEFDDLVIFVYFYCFLLPFNF